MAKGKKSKGKAKKTITITKFLTDKMIRLKVSCSKDGWELLQKEYFSALSYRRNFESDFYSQFVLSAKEKINKPKSIHNNSSFVLMMKAQAAILYLFFRPYFEYQKQIKKYPGYNSYNFAVRIFDFNKVYAFMQNKMLPFCYIEFDHYESVIKDIQSSLEWRNPNSKHNPVLYVAYCMQTVYEDLLDENKISYFLQPPLPWQALRVVRADLDNFYKTYITQGIKLLKEHLKINTTNLRRYKKYNHVDRFIPDTETTFCKSVKKLYVWYCTKIARERFEDTRIVDFVENLLHAMLFILSNGSVKILNPEEKRIYEFLADLLKGTNDFIPYRYTLTDDELHILGLTEHQFKYS